MNSFVKSGLNVYKIFLKNKLASSVMMFFSGIMMFIAAMNGYGNDTKSLPILITVVGSLLTIWSIYRFGYIKSNFDEAKQNGIERKELETRMLFLQLGETAIYFIVAGIGIFLLLNDGFMDKALNLMTGGFTTLNGVLGAIKAYKNREQIDFRWKMMLVLTILELVLGAFFIFGSSAIGIGWYIVMGLLTTVAGFIEVVSVLTEEGIESTLDDGKKIVEIIKDEINEQEMKRNSGQNFDK